MITKCRFCDYSKQTDIDLNILTKVVASYGIQEDMELYMRELFTDFKAWRGVKVHMGRMHKLDAYYGMWPDIAYNEAELAVLARVK